MTYDIENDDKEKFWLGYIQKYWVVVATDTIWGWDHAASAATPRNFDGWAAEAAISLPYSVEWIVCLTSLSHRAASNIGPSITSTNSGLDLLSF